MEGGSERYRPRDRAPADPPPAVGSALRRADRALALVLAAAWLALGAQAIVSPGGGGPNRLSGLALVAAALLTVATWVEAAATAAGLLLALALLRRPPGNRLILELGLAAAALLRLFLQTGEAGRWLRRVRRLERRRARALLASELARARGAIVEAGDAFERAGIARRALESEGAEPSAAVAAVARGAGVLAGLGRRLASRRRVRGAQREGGSSGDAGSERS